MLDAAPQISDLITQSAAHFSCLPHVERALCMVRELPEANTAAWVSSTPDRRAAVLLTQSTSYWLEILSFLPHSPSAEKYPRTLQARLQASSYCANTGRLLVSPDGPDFMHVL